MLATVTRTITLSAALLACAAARAETFELANGGTVRGELLNPEENPRKTFNIQLTAGAIISLAPSQVLRVAEKSEAELWYDEARKSMTSDVAGHLELASQCKTKRLDAQRIFHLEEVLKLEPENPKARRELGYSKLDGEWVNLEVWHRQRGYVKHKGSWVLPQEVEIQKLVDAEDKKFHEWNEQIRRWRGWIMKQNDRSAEGLQNLLAIDDVAAAPVLAKLLDEKNEPVTLKRAYIKVLGRLPGTTSTVALVRRALNDNDANVRDDALDELARRNDKNAVRLFVGILRHAADENTTPEHNVLVNLAAAGLAKLQDDSATLPLIETLVTKHKFVLKSGGSGLNPVFSKDPTQPGGGGGVNVGGRPEIVLREINNQNVRDALISLHPGINFGYDEAMWKRWYEQQQTPALVDLRRDID